MNAILTWWRAKPPSDPAMLARIIAELEHDRLEPLVRRKPKAVKRPQIEDMAFLHVKDLLDEIPAARVALRKLKKFDKDAYQFHRRFGARITGWEGGKAGIRYQTLRKGVLESLPGVGLIFAVPYSRWGIDDHDMTDTSDDDTVRAYFYFIKMRRKAWAVEVCPHAKAYYELSVAFTDTKRTVGYSTTVAVTDNGDVRTLKSLRMAPQRLPDGERIWHREFNLSPGLRGHHADRQRVCRDDSFTAATPEEFGEHLFCMALNSFDASSDGFQITATRDGMAVTFNVPGSRAKRFFKDRDIEIAADGKRRRIFHTVDAHDRLLGDGRTIKVRAHYRGARKFVWKGEAIRIMPQEQGQRDFDLEAVFIDERDKPRSQYVRMPPVGALMENLFEEQAEVRGGYRPD